MGVVVHVGYQKTATTAIQATVFPRIDRTWFLNREDEFFEFARSIEARPDAEPFSVERWRPYLEESRRRAPVLLLSREDFSTRRRWEMVAERLHDVLPDARIVVCVRNQATMIPSFYSQHLKGGGYRSFRSWLQTFPLEVFEYDRLVARYQELFGADAVSVLAFEHLVQDPDGFVAHLCDTISPGSPPAPDADVRSVNRGLAPPSQWVFRIANRLFRRSAANERPLLPAEPVWRALESAVHRMDPVFFPRMGRAGSPADRRLVEELLPRFGPSNTRLQALTGLDVAGYGYPMAAPAATAAG
jgi:hypothetical protein